MRKLSGISTLVPKFKELPPLGTQLLLVLYNFSVCWKQPYHAQKQQWAHWTIVYLPQQMHRDCPILHLWVYQPETCTEISKWVYLHCVKMFSKNHCSKFWWCHCKSNNKYNFQKIAKNFLPPGNFKGIILPKDPEVKATIYLQTGIPLAFPVFNFMMA